MSINIHLWGGDLHQHVVGTHSPADWATAAQIIEMAVETGLLVTVLHSDFTPPPAKLKEANAAALETMNRLHGGQS